jgi:hypothetical protein
MATVMLKKSWWFSTVLEEFSPGAIMERAVRESGEPVQVFIEKMRQRMTRFRSLIPQEEVGMRGKAMFFDTYPRVPIHKKLWPYHVDE